MTKKTLSILTRDATSATLSTMTRSLGRLFAMIVIARSAGLSGVSSLALCVSIETIVICTLNAMFASPPAVLCPGRRRDLRAAVHDFAERAQLYAGLVANLLLGVAAIGVSRWASGAEAALARTEAGEVREDAAPMVAAVVGRTISAMIRSAMASSTTGAGE